MADVIFAGIDFGAKSSSIGVWNDDSEVVILECEGGQKFLPTLVDYSRSLVGKAAENSNSNEVISFVKQLLGKEFNSIDEINQLDPKNLHPILEERKPRFMVPGRSESISPEDVADLIFSKMKAIIEERLKSKAPIKVVISVPANATEAYRTAIEGTAKRAGFNSVLLVPEPEAVALAYNIEVDNKEYSLAIVDVGESSIGVSLSTFLNKTLTVHTTSYIPRQTGNAVTEEVKREINKVVEAFPDVDIHCVALVGGFSRNREVVWSTEVGFGIEVFKVFSRFDSVNANAYGATWYAAKKFGDSEDLPVICGRASRRIGLQTFGGVMTPFIKEDTLVPMTEPIIQEATTSRDKQKQVVMNIYEGLDNKARRNKLLGTFTLSGISPANRGVPKIEISFILDQNGILVVEATDKSRNVRKKLEVAKQ